MNRLAAIATTMALFCGAFASCEKTTEKEEPETKLPPVLTIGTNELTVSAAGGNQSISYKLENPVQGSAVSMTSDMEWVSSIDCSSIGTISFDVAENKGDAREAALCISYPELQSITITLKQMAAGEEISLSAESYNASVGGGRVEVTVTSDRDWTLEGSADWISTDKNSGVSGEVVTFTISQNDNTDSRSAEFIFNCASKSVSFSVSQEGKTILSSIKDEVLRAELLRLSDTDGDGQISLSEASAVKELNLPYNKYDSTSELIEDLEGLSYFTGLELIVLTAHQFSEADFSMMPNLKTVDLSQNEYLYHVDVSAAKGLKSISVSLDPELTELDLSGKEELEVVNAYSSKIKAIDVSASKNLRSLSLNGTAITTLDLSNNVELESFQLGIKTLKSVTFPSILPKISSVNLDGSEILANVDLTPFVNAKSINLSYAPVTSIDLSKCEYLETIHIDYCKKIKKLDVSNNLRLTTISAISASSLSSVTCFEGQWDAISDNCWGIQKSMIKTVPLEYPEDCAALITDDGLRNYILNKYDTDADGKISGEESKNVTSIKYTGKGLKEFTNFVYFRNIKELNLSNNELTYVELIPFAKTLETLDLSNNKLTSISMSETNNLVEVNLKNNQLKTVSGYFGSGSWKLESFNAANNQIESFSFPYSKNLVRLDLSNNQLTSLDVQSCVKLTELNVSNNKLTQETTSFVRPATLVGIQVLDLSHNNFERMESDVDWTSNWTELLIFYCNDNSKLKLVDLSPCEKLSELNCSECPKLDEISISAKANPYITKDDHTQVVKK